MAFSKIGGKGIDLSTDVITEFNSTGVDDNATATTITLNANNTATIPNVTGNTTFNEYITVTNLTVNNDASISNDLTVGGNFIITGNTFTVDSTSLKVEDSLIHLAGNNVSNDIIDIGFIGHYSNDSGNTELFTGFYRDATDEQYYLFNGLSDDINTATTIDKTGTGYTLATLNIGALNGSGDVHFSTLNTKVTIGPSLNASVHTGTGIKASTPRLTFEPTADAQTSRIQFANTGGTQWGSIFAYNDTERMQFSANTFNFNNGNVGIGTASPLNQLVISEGTGQHGIEFAAGTTSYIQAYDRAISDYGDLKIDAQIIQFGTDNGTERMRIDSSGRIFIGKISDNDNTAGHTLHSSGLVVHTRDSSFTTIFNRTTDDGDIAQFKKDGALIGNIGTASGGLFIGCDDAGIFFNHHGGGDLDAIFPYDVGTKTFYNGHVDIGGSSNRFKDLYLSNSVKVITATNGTSIIDLGDTADSDIGRIAYDNSVDAMYFKTNNIERMRITSSGNVIIDGSDASTSLASTAILNLKAGDANNEYSILRFATSADGSIGYIGAKATTTGAYPSSVGNLEFGVQNGASTVTAMTINNSGNVGIGTVSPATPLTVQANSGAGAVALNGRSSDGIATLGFYASNGTTEEGYVQGRSDSLRVWASTNNYLSLAANNQERFKIDVNGEGTFSGNFIPGTDNTYSLGNTSYRWANVWTTDLHLSNKGKTNDVDGTWGDWTIQEGDENLFIINNRTGKKYKFALQEVN